MAAGTWAPSLVPPGSSPLPVRPVRGQLLHLAAPPRTLRHVVWGADVYLVPWRDGTVFVGATSEDVGFDERTTASGVASLLDAAIALVPALAGATFVEARRGLRPASPDEPAVRRPLGGAPGPDLRLRALPQRRPPGAADRGAGGRPGRRRRAPTTRWHRWPRRAQVGCRLRRMGQVSLLPDADIAARLAQLPGWRAPEAAIVKEFTFAGFPEAVAFVVRLVAPCEAADHHPDLAIHYRRVIVTFTTHSAGGLTEKDFAGARAADAVAR